MAITLGDNRYGKAEVRLVRVVRDGARHELRDLTVSVALAGDLAAAHEGDNSGVLPTDTQKN
ncbi:MAG TPA: urate oxidase, partial [Asanoa sp.]|nr:urate oxidase [Asanoa sp.]